MIYFAEQSLLGLVVSPARNMNYISEKKRAHSIRPETAPAEKF